MYYNFILSATPFRVGQRSELIESEAEHLIEILNKCRKGDSEKNLKSEIINTACMVVLGICLGVFSKFLDNTAVNDEILWQRMLGIIDLRNVFSRLSIWALLAFGIAIYSKRPSRASINVFGFFVGMLAGYYTVTITVSGFFPKTYMIAWGVITLFTPLLAFFAWYAKGTGWLSISISAMTIGFFITQALSFGMWYIDIKYFAELICLIFAIIILNKKGKPLLYSLLGALLVSPLIKMVLPYIFGGL